MRAARSYSAGQTGRRNMMAAWRLAVVVAAALAALPAAAQTVKIGAILSLSGNDALPGLQIQHGMELYVKEHEKSLPPGVKVDLLIRDDTGNNPEAAKRLAQELVARDHVNLLSGVVYTPNPMAIAPIATE